jgi:hypothetical protein
MDKKFYAWNCTYMCVFLHKVLNFYLVIFEYFSAKCKNFLRCCMFLT